LILLIGNSNHGKRYVHIVYNNSNEIHRLDHIVRKHTIEHVGKEHENRREINSNCAQGPQGLMQHDAFSRNDSHSLVGDTYNVWEAFVNTIDLNDHVKELASPHFEHLPIILVQKYNENNFRCRRELKPTKRQLIKFICRRCRVGFSASECKKKNYRMKRNAHHTVEATSFSCCKNNSSSGFSKSFTSIDGYCMSFFYLHQ
jgi:hypothetical protein